LDHQDPDSNRDTLRLLFVGPYNSPHVEDLAIAMSERGHAVHVGGHLWGGLPESSLSRHRVPTSPMTFPAVLWLRRLLRQFQPDVVHAHWMPFAGLAAIAGAHPLVTTAWGSDVYGVGRRRRLEARLALLRTSVATADSSDLLRRLQELGPRSLRTMLSNWGVDLETFRVPTAAERAQSKAHFGLGPGPVVFSPRGLNDIYNPRVVVEAFELLRATIPNSQLVLKHGGSSEIPPEWSKARGIHTVGRIEHDEMAELFRAAEVTVSIAETDSSPRSVWEAMASGSATVLSNRPWVHELIEGGRDALVVDVDARAVADAVERLLRHGEERARIVASARALVERHRDRTVELARLESCYRELASQRSA
jgi:glycosyltransferase involved in cell wall biosynthesis